jgi:hypothetical protein
MSFSYDRYDRRQSSSSRRTTFGYWVPLVLTVTVATAGFAAWVWSERRDDEDSDDADLSYGEDGDGRMPEAARSSRDSLSQGVVRDDEGIMGRVHGVIRRTPSPQQLFDSVSKKTAAGFAAAGAAAGAALASIREEDRDDFADHNRWTEEAEMKRRVEAQSSQSAAAVDVQAKSFAASVKGGPSTGGRRKTVAIVVSAESLMDNPHEDDSSYRSENAVSENDKVGVHKLIRPRPSSPTSPTPTSPRLSSSSSSTRPLSAPVPTPAPEPPLSAPPTRPSPRLRAPPVKNSSPSTPIPKTPFTPPLSRHAALTTSSGTPFTPKPFASSRTPPWSCPLPRPMALSTCSGTSDLT